MAKKKMSLMTVVILGILMIVILKYANVMPFATMGSGGTKYVMQMHWDNYKCEPIKKPDDYRSQDLKGQLFLFIPTYQDVTVSLGTYEFTDEAEVYVYCESFPGIQQVDRTWFSKCNYETNMCGPNETIVMSKLDLPKKFFIDKITVGEYLHITTNCNGYIIKRYKQFGLRDTASGMVINGRNCFLGEGFDYSKICKAGNCNMTHNLALQPYDTVSYISSYSVVPSNLAVNFDNAKGTYCDPATLTLYGTSEYVAYDGTTYIYPDATKVIRHVECCPSTTSYCTADYKLSEDIQKDKYCSLPNGTLMFGWTFGDSGHTKVIQGVCIDHKIVYNVKQTVCSQCKISEVCVIDQAIGNTRCVQQGGGMPNPEPTPPTPVPTPNPAPTTHSDMFWIIVGIFVLVVLVVLLRR